ncbi:PASTA domain-containing protein [Enterococcus sp. BWB1-3]|uniref:PASTA domain-containing protein n=1 Tax=unclassified Enterococcus TaxID=2608891 RepID=UPI0019225BEC|nr:MULTISPECIES: PASTA domain-containing protein [unclassified Enterococcus]MBL1228519.1 PASTA domain-containing protein [Enterococcus sp. BWB1-3]MCB5954415.1 PASTA domain-containing protein [Enterococcus sp. CWB-B31]
MSDFLANFENKNYEKTRQDKLYEKKKDSQRKNSQKGQESEQKQTGKAVKENDLRSAESSLKKTSEPIKNVQTEPIGELSVEELLRQKKQQRYERQAAREAAEVHLLQGVNEQQAQNTASKAAVKQIQEPVQQSLEYENETAAPGEELTETDPGYRRKKIIKYIVLAIGTAAAIGIGIFAYYQYTHVTVPDFVGKELSEARAWTTENGVTLKIEQIYDFDKPTNQIISQNVQNKKIKKGSELLIDASLGPDPEEVIALPEFKDMSKEAANEWIAANKADSLSLIEEYNETKPAGEFIKLEIGAKDITVETYRRKDKANIYFSKGAEPLEKTIEVTDFVGKTKEEAEEWSKKNELAIEISESDSDTVETGKVISQEAAKGTKLAKKDKFPVVISTGKAYVVPDFSQMSMTDAESNESVSVRQIYHDTVPYGGFVSQSVEAGQTFKEAEKPGIELVYSIGKPFIRDLKDSTLEGDLQKIFYEEYQSKGANVTFQVYYVDSEVTKGTVVQMSQYNEFVSTNAVIRISISRGNIVRTEEDPASVDN